MSVTRIATRYAKSLLELAVEQNKLESVHADVSLLNTVAQNREMHLLLKSPVVHSDKKIAVIDALFKDKVESLTLAYLHLLINKGREGYIPEIAAEFVAQYKYLQHITTVRVTTAAPLSEVVLDDLRKKILASGITFENLDIETAVDPELIGGFVLEFDNKRYDASTSHKLEELKAEFKKNLYVKEF